MLTVLFCWNRTAGVGSYLVTRHQAEKVFTLLCFSSSDFLCDGKEASRLTELCLYKQTANTPSATFYK